MSDFEKIINGGYCIGCGACSAASNGVIPIEMNSYGMYQANPKPAHAFSAKTLDTVLKSCPFSNVGPNEDAIGKTLFSKTCRHDLRIGYYRKLHIGFVAEAALRSKGTSGGLITWVLTKLLNCGEIDAVVHVRKSLNTADGILFRYSISSSPEEIADGAKSRYYPIEMSDVLDQVRKAPGRYALVGLPCFVKAVRKLAEVDPLIRERIRYCIGLVCGHLKSKAFADCYGWQAGISPGKLEYIDFRVKLPGRSAGDYGVFLEGDRIAVTRRSCSFLGSVWGQNFFRYSACDACDDVFAETADLSAGDAWLPEYANDPNGTSILVVRNENLFTLLENGITSAQLHLESTSPDTMASTQAGGLRDRREGLSYRLQLLCKQGKWVPEKRVLPGSFKLSLRRKLTYRNRAKIAARSHIAFVGAVRSGDFQLFRDTFRNLIRWNEFLRSPRSFFGGRLRHLLKRAAHAFRVGRD